MNKSLIVVSLAALVLAVAVAAVALMGILKATQFLALEETKVRNQAIDGCAQNSKYIHTEVNGNVTDVFEEPNQGLYQQCLQLKNIQ